MEVRIKCPACAKRLPVSAGEAPEAIRCGGCSREIGLSFSNALRDDSGVDVCPLCEGRDVYSRKDFDQKAGLTFIIVSAVVSAGFYFYGLDLVAYGILAA